MTDRDTIDADVDQVLLNEYRVERHLGEGGYGKVDLVTSILTGAQYALKRAHVENKSARRELLAEVRSWMNLAHYPHIATCRFFRLADNTVYIFSEYVNGGSLADWQQTGRIYEGSPENILERLFNVAIQSAWGLHVAHQQGLIHQDIKPSNVLLTKDEQVKLVDFGLTEKVQPDLETESLLDYLLQDIGDGATLERGKSALRKKLDVGNQQQAVKGSGSFTARYASPEQLNGEPLTIATDIWSWGVMLLELFNGKCAWELGFGAPAVLEKLISQGPTCDLPPPLPARVAKVIKRCLNSDSADRWPSMAEASNELALAYKDSFGHEYQSPAPAISQSASTNLTRELPSGSQWDNPRGWIAYAYELDGKTEEQASKYYPDHIGSAISRALSDLEALEHAAEIIERHYQTGNNAIAGDLGKIYGNLGLLSIFLGDMDGALNYYDKSEKLLKAEENQYDQVILRNSMAILLRKMGRGNESIQVCDKALNDWGKYESKIPEDEYKKYRALLLNTRANATTDAAERIRNRSEAVALSADDETEHTKYLTGQVFDYALLHDWENYDKVAKRARDTLVRLVNEEHKLALRGTLGAFHINSAHYSVFRRRWDDALNHLEDGTKVLEPLIAEEGQWEYAGELGKAHFEKGKVLEAIGRPFDALASYSVARGKLSEIILRGGRSDLANELADTLRNEANLSRSVGQSSEAIELSEDSVDLFRRLMQSNRGDQYLSLLSNALTVHSGCLLGANQVQEGIKVAEEAVDLCRALPSPLSSRQLINYAGALMALGIAARRAEDGQTAWDAYQEALDILETTDETEAQGLKALLQFNSSNLLGDSGYVEDSLKLLDKAIAILEDLEQHGYAPGYSKDDLVLALKAKSNQLLIIGDYEQALAVSNETLAHMKKMVEQEHRRDLNEEYTKLCAARAILFKKLGDFQGAIDAFHEAAERFRQLGSNVSTPQLQQAADYMENQASELKALAEFSSKDTKQLEQNAEQEIQTGTQFSMQGDSFHACEMFEEAKIIYSILFDQQPSERWLEKLASTQLQLAIVAMHSGRNIMSENAYREAINHYDQLITEFNRPDELNTWGNACSGLAAFLQLAGREEEGKCLMNETQERMQSLGESEYREWLSSAQTLLDSI